MGGCCCSSRKHQFHGTPVYYYVSHLIYQSYQPYFEFFLLNVNSIPQYPRGSEEHDSLTSHDGMATVRASALLIDVNLNMSTPDTYRSPPAPLPYDLVYGRPESTDPESGEVTLSARTLEKPGCIVFKEANSLKESEILSVSPKKVDLEFLKSEPLTVSTDEDDTCPTCLEEYDKENPKILTECSHHFHLSCILEWKERSNMCPICDQEMIYERV
ncbi:putative E3 ubiquitin-protein ligase RHB1A isoform X2 [Primulina tabacum]